MQISEAAAQSGLSIDTIRYYERSGLIPAIARGADGRRRFYPQAVEWLVLLSSLRSTGMPMQRMRRFAELYQKGDETIPERRRMLLDHKDQLDVRRAELEHCQALLTYKLQKYDEREGD